MLEKRNKLSKEECLSHSRKIMQNLFSTERFRQAKIIGFYMAKGSEVPTIEMIHEALKLGKKVAVPVTNDDMEFCEFSDDLTEGKFGILEPRARIPLQPDLVIVPGIAFGRCMHRLGYGKGYYDKYLKRTKAYRMGICFDFQIFNELPRHEDDVPMNEIVTEERIIK